jgi:hypothetical protein
MKPAVWTRYFGTAPASTKFLVLLDQCAGGQQEIQWVPNWWPSSRNGAPSCE